MYIATKPRRLARDWSVPEFEFNKNEKNEMIQSLNIIANIAIALPIPHPL